MRVVPKLELGRTCRNVVRVHAISNSRSVAVTMKIAMAVRSRVIE